MDLFIEQRRESSLGVFARNAIHWKLRCEGEMSRSKLVDLLKTNK
jgi:hypothetical protein